MTDKTFIKAVNGESGEWMLDVLGVPFGGPINGRDKDGEFFDATSDLWLDQIGKRAVVHYHGFNADGTQAAEPEIIGQEISHEVKTDGAWFRVILDKTKEIARKIWEAAQAGSARASSGALSHLVRTNKMSGHIDVWPMAELSLMDMNAGQYPSNSYAVALPAVRATFKAAGLDLPELTDNSEINEPTEPNPGEDLEQIEETTMTDQVLTMDQVKAFVETREAETAEKARIKALEDKAAELDALKAQITDAEKAAKDNQQVKRLPNPPPGTGAASD